jgi:hypothetical protein
MSVQSLLLSVLVVLQTASAFADDVSEFTLPSGVAVKIVEAPFGGADFRVSRCSPEGYNCLVNGRIPFGTTRTPTTFVKSITISYAGTTHELDVSDMYDAWGHRSSPSDYFGGKCWDANDCHVRGLFSDAGGSFVAEWLVWEGAVTRTVITGSGDVVNLFQKNLEPPEYE